MKKITLSFLSLFIAFTQTTEAQIGIGTIAPEPSAILELKSTTKGFLPPRLINDTIFSI